MKHRLDKRGRRIGHNAWRDHIVDAWFWADQAWWRRAEEVTSMYDTEFAEHHAANPRPNLGDFMTALSPSWGATCTEAA